MDATAAALPRGDRSGDTIVVGAPADESGQLGVGAAYVFTRSGGVLSLAAKLRHAGPFVGDRFGTSVAASGDTIAVVAPGQVAILATSVFTLSSGFSREALLEQEVALTGNAIHGRLSLAGDLLAVATDSETASPGLGRGMVTLYVRRDGAWGLRQVLASNEANQADNFGSDVEIAGGGSAFLAIGDMTKIGRVNNDGAAYAYRLDTTGPVIECPGDLFAREEAGVGAVVFFVVRSTDDFASEPTIECAPASGSFFPTGSTPVTCRALDDVNNESTCEFVVHVQPDEVFFRRGNVNAAAEDVVDVLYVNDSPGDPVERTLHLAPADPLGLRVESPPSREDPTTRLAMYAWLREPSAATVRMLPGGIGSTCLPTPLNPGGAQPKRIANSLGHTALLGSENWPGPQTLPAPTTLLSLAAVGRPLTLFAQGIILDSASLHGTVAVTNGVIVRVSE